MRSWRVSLRLARAGAVALVVLEAGGAASVTACGTYSNSLARSEHAFEDGDLERALATLRALEVDLDHLSAPERAQYAYLRGTIDFRMGYRADARHWLAIGAALEQQTPGSLPAAWMDRLRAALHDLDEEVFTAVAGADAGPPAN
jgi:hypothetical protein